MDKPELPKMRVVYSEDDPYGDIELHLEGFGCIARLWLDDAPVRDYNDAQVGHAMQITKLWNDAREAYGRAAALAEGQVLPLREALEKIVRIENQLTGPDWEEIEKARAIARAALSAPSPTGAELLTEEELNAAWTEIETSKAIQRAFAAKNHIQLKR